MADAKEKAHKEVAAPAAGHAPTGEAKKKPETHSGKGKAPAQVPGGCASWGCKHEATRFNFCEEHFDHFKFGLIKKTGEPVSDYEKKIEHYVAYKARLGAQKAA